PGTRRWLCPGSSAVSADPTPSPPTPSTGPGSPTTPARAPSTTQQLRLHPKASGHLLNPRKLPGRFPDWPLFRIIRRTIRAPTAHTAKSIFLGDSRCSFINETPNLLG